MFMIYGGGTEFQQWEQGKMLTNEHMAAGDCVVFRQGSGKTIPVTARTQDGTVVVDVPNDLLMNHANIVVDLKHRPTCRTHFKVNKCDCPDGYKPVQNIPEPAPKGGASSWNDLKDKPFGTETITVLEKQVFEFVEDKGFHVLRLPNTVEIPAGNVTVFWDGVEYKCANEGFGFGSTKLLGMGGDTGEPFAFMFGDTDWIALATDNSASHEIGIICEAVHKIGAEYMPKNVVFCVDLNDISGEMLQIFPFPMYDGDIPSFTPDLYKKIAALKNNNTKFTIGIDDVIVGIVDYNVGDNYYYMELTLRRTKYSGSGVTFEEHFNTYTWDNENNKTVATSNVKQYQINVTPTIHDS